MVGMLKHGNHRQHRVFIMKNINPFFIPSSKSLIVFGKNKLNGTDGIMPLLLELAIKKDLKIIYCVAEYGLTYKAIQDNVLFRDIIYKYGSLNLLGGFSKYRTIRYITWLFQLFFIFVQGIAGGRIIHYGAMNNFPFNLLRISYGKKVFLSENNTNETFYRQTMQEIDRICNKSKVQKNQKNYLFDESCIDDRIIFRKSTMKKFNKDNGYRFYFYGRSRSRSIWLNYLSENKHKYFEKYHPNIRDKKYIVIIGTWYDGCLYNNVPKVFEKMLDVFKENFNEEYFLFKPHPLTNISYVKKEIEKRKLKCEITYLHPNLLAMQAKAFVGNNFSNMMTDGFLQNIPTIEFSNYIDELKKMTCGSSASSKYVNHFIDNDSTQFKSIMGDVIISALNDSHVNLEKIKIDEPSSVGVLNLIASDT
jgi:hypothetical protein